MSEYLLLFDNEITPKSLRDKGFLVGNLSTSVEVVYDKIESSVLNSTDFEKSYLGLQDSQSDNRVLNPTENTRTGYCKIGFLYSAVFSLTFIMSNKNLSLFLKKGHKIEDSIFIANHIEIDCFYINKQCRIQDFFVVFIKQVLKISLQENIGSILLESKSEIKPILEKLGFQYLNSSLKSKDSNTEKLYLMRFNVLRFKDLARQNKVPKHIMNLYGDIINYLNL